MPQSGGSIFTLPSEYFGLSGLGQSLGQIGNTLYQKKQNERDNQRQDDTLEFQKNQAIFSNLMALGDREAAADFQNTVIQPGGTAEAQLTADQWLDKRLVGALNRGSLGEQLSPFDQDLINTRVFSSLTPEVDKLLKDGELTQQGLVAEAYRISNEGGSLQNIGTELSNRAMEIQNQRLAREDRDRANLDRLTGQMFPQYADVGYPAIQFESQRQAILNARADNMATMQSIAESAARMRRIDQEIASLTQTDKTNMAELFAPQIRSLMEMTGGRVDAQTVLNYYINPATELPEETKAVLDEASSTLRDVAMSQAREVLNKASNETRQMLTTLAQIPSLRDNPDLIMPVLAGAINEAFGPNTASIQEVSTWFGFGREKTFDLDEDKIINVAQAILPLAAQEGNTAPAVIDPEYAQGIATNMLSTYEGDISAARASAEQQLSEAQNADERALIQSVLDALPAAPDTAAAVPETNAALEQATGTRPAIERGGIALQRRLVERARAEIEADEQRLDSVSPSQRDFLRRRIESNKRKLTSLEDKLSTLLGGGR